MKTKISRNKGDSPLYFILKLLFPLLIINYGYANGKSEIIINGMAPTGLNFLAQDIAIDYHGEATYDNDGKSHCYKKKWYVISTEYLVSDEYILTKNKPDKLKCYQAPKDLIESNKMGFYIGMKKNDIEIALNIMKLRDHQNIEWHTIDEVNSILSEILTNAEFIFENDELVYLRVLHSITN